MPLEQFWTGEPRLAKVYRDAAYMRTRRDNERAWRAGIYYKYALESVIGNMFRKRGSAPIEYVKEPLPLTEAEVAERAERDARLAEQRIIDRMNKLASSESVTRKV